MSEAMERIVSAYVASSSGAALEALHQHCRTRIATLAALRKFDASVAIERDKIELAIIEAGINRLKDRST